MESPEINPYLHSKLIFDGKTSTNNDLKIVYLISGIGKIGEIPAEK